MRAARFTYVAEEIVQAAYDELYIELRDALALDLTEAEHNCDQTHRTMHDWIKNDIRSRRDR